MDIPLLLETVEPSTSSAHGEPKPNEPADEDATDDADDQVPMLMLDDALIEDPTQEHMAPLSDPLDEDKRLQPGAPSITPEEMLDLQSALAARSEAPGTTAPANPAPTKTDPASALNLAAAALLESTRSAAESGADGAAEPPRKTENPFLPQHILDKLHQGRRTLVEEIAQSSAALDASTALFRSRTRPDRFERIAALGQLSPPTHAKSRISDQRDQMVDELVAEFLPLVAAELRRRLKRMLND